jgi:glycosyltransferase involved in cell wall biosynthesis
MNNPYFSVVSPVYGCKTSLYELYFRLKETLEKITPDFEIILVNDASPDDAWETIVELSDKDKRVKGISFSRNFGQHYAITAGLEYCSGDWIVVMDCDLQDKPEEITKLYNKVREGFDVIFGRRVKRQDKVFKKFFSRTFYKLFNILTDNISDSTVSNFGIYSQLVIQNYLKFTEKTRLFPLLIKWQGFKTGYVDIEHSKRTSSKSSYNYFKLINLALDAIISQSNKPLRISIKVGLSMSFFSFLYLIYLILRKFYLDIPMGWTSIMVSIFFIGGLIFANLGLIGLYIGKIYDEIKNRPLYIVKEVIGEFNKKPNA